MGVIVVFGPWESRPRQPRRGCLAKDAPTAGDVAAVFRPPLWRRSVARRHGCGRSRYAGFSSNCASISTVMFIGSDDMPTALRAPMPQSGPNNSANSSLNPLITAG